VIEPRRIGRFLAVDEFGYVEPDVASEHIGAAWLPLVAFVRDVLMRRPGVRSVYLRGSIARGLAIENVSDADFMYFSETSYDAADIELEKAVAAKFPVAKDLELSRLDRATFDKIDPWRERPYFHMLLKTQCLFLAGDDIASDIAPFRIGPEMVCHVFSLPGDFARLPRLLQEGRNGGVEQAMWQWFSRRIVRSGFEITMDRSDRFTRDLYLCYEQFAAFYPERAEPMFRVLVNCLNGKESPLQYGELVAFLAAEGARLTAATLHL
jgi:uncharacterized protein